ncbi:MAG: Ser-Thr-rich GPI-anchored membrane family protein [Candidatus Omnitrophota bacterium]
MGALTVSVPGAGTESWDVNTTQAIKFKKKGNLQSADVYYAYNGTTYTKINTTAINISGAPDGEGNYTFNWYIDPASTILTSGFAGKIKVTAVTPTTQTSVEGIQNNAIEVKGTVTLDDPSASGISMAVGNSYTIKWTKTGNITSVQLHYSTTGGGVGGYPDGNLITTVSATPPSHSWTVADKIGSNLRIRVMDANNSNVWDESNNVFTIVGKVNLTVPDGGQIWTVGTTHQITWTKTGTFNYVKLEHSVDGDTSYLVPPIVSQTDAGALSYNWVIPDTIGNNNKIRISDPNYPNLVKDVSTDVFTIVGALDLTGPNGAEVWYVGDTNRNITWNAIGTITAVKIEYSTNGGGAWSTINNGAPGVYGSNTYSWTPIPDAISKNCLVKISDPNFPSVSDQSAAVFDIRPKLTVTVPNGSERWLVSSNQLIRWTHTGSIGQVKIEYSTNSGSTYSNVVASTEGATDQYLWTNIPDTISANCQVKITRVDDSAVVSVSPTFKIIGSVNLTKPVVDEKVKIGTSYKVEWTMVGSITNVRLEYSTNNGSSFGYSIVDSTPANALSYFWNVGNPPSPNCVIKISDYNDAVTYDTSEVFKIQAQFNITDPDGGEVLEVGKPYSIKWSTIGSVSTVKLEYTSNGGSTYNTITDSVSNTGNYSWTVPPVITTQAKVKVSDTNDSTSYNESAATFKIRGVLTLTAPNGGETWVVGSSQNITWQRSGPIANIRLDYSIDGGTSYPGTLPGNPITTSYSASAGTFPWTVPDKLSSTARVKITDVTDDTVCDTSDANFTIKGVITITRPIGGEIFRVGSTENVTWTKVGTFANVKIEFSVGGAAYEVIPGAESITATNGTFGWNIPDRINDNVKVRISNAGTEPVDTSTSGSLAIKGVLKIDAPVGTDIWNVDKSYDILWTRTGSVANAKLEYSYGGGAYQTIISSVNASLGTYNWTIPNTISNNVRVKITQTTDNLVVDTSPVFKIAGYLDLTYPNGGETLVVDENVPITWVRHGTIAAVDLYYSKDNGADGYPYQIANAVPAANQSYTWPVPDSIGTQVKVKIADDDTGSYTSADTSAAAFEIRGSLTITSPILNDVWISTTSHNITWVRHGSIANAKLQYSVNSGSTFPYTIVASIDAGSLSYSWTIPNTTAKNAAMVKITNLADSNVYDDSDIFTIRGGFIITAPTAVTRWPVNSSQNITWTTFGSIANVMLKYSTNNGATWNPITVDPITNINEYLWTIPVDATLGNQTLVKVYDSNDADAVGISPQFVLHGILTVSQPNGGEQWGVGTSQQITWTRVGSIASIKLEYSTNGGTNFTTIIGTTPAANLSYSWTIPESTTLSTQCLIKITDVSDSLVVDTSNNYFKIKASFTVTTPNGNETLVCGETKTVQWGTVGDVPSVNLEYTTDSGSTWTLLPGMPITNTGSSNWSIPTTVISNQVKIRVSDSRDSSAYDTSDNNFKIVGKLTVTVPNGGEKWGVDSQQLIQWNTVGPIDKAKLQYRNPSGIYINIFETPIDNNGNYLWTVPNAITSEAKIKVIDGNDSAVLDESNNYFKIMRQFDVTAPVGGQTWLAGSAQQIRWTTHGTSGNVKLEYSTNNGATFTVITSSVSDNGFYDWTVVNQASGDCYIKVSDAGDADAYKSSGKFRIRAILTLTAPTGGQILKFGDNYNITWTQMGKTGTVKLEYSDDDFVGSDNVISDTVPTGDTGGSYTWTVPDFIRATNVIKVRVSDPQDNGAVSTSGGLKIVTRITVNKPDVTSKWYVNDYNDITWNWTGTVPRVSLYYSPSGGAAGTYVAITAIDNTDVDTAPATQTGKYTWYVPNSITAQLKVKVCDERDETDGFGVSGGDAKIRAKFTLSAPNGGQEWVAGSTETISWSNIGTVNYVNLDYSTNSGATYSYNIATNVPNGANGGSYNWTIPESIVISRTVRVRVMSSSDSDAYDDSNSDLRLKGKLLVTAPASSSSWKVGSNYTITWNTNGPIQNVDILYSINSGSAFPYTVAANLANSGSKTWTIPDTVTPNAVVRVRDASSGNTDVLDDSEVFRIVGSFTLTSPNTGAEKWKVASIYAVTWNWTGTISSVKLSYSTDSGSTFPYSIGTVSNGAGGSGSYSYNWTIPDTISTAVRVKIEDPNDSTVFDISDNNFRIQATFTITAPNGGERWVTNEGGDAWENDLDYKLSVGQITQSERDAQSRRIKWQTVGTPQYIKLLYSTDGSTYPYVIVVSMSNTGTYNWTIPDTRSTTSRVKVVDVYDDTSYDVSNNNFKIDYYQTIWELRDLLTNALVSPLDVESTSGWQEAGLSPDPVEQGVVHDEPYGTWTVTWKATGFGDKKITYNCNQDQRIKEFMETTVIHLWEAESEFTYDPTTDDLAVTSWLERDGGLITGGLYYELDIYDDTGQLIKVIKPAGEGEYSEDAQYTNTSGQDPGEPDAAGFYHLLWSDCGLESGAIYSTITKIQIGTGALFKTSKALTVTEQKTTQELTDTINEQLDVPLSQVQADVATELSNQTGIITIMMGQQTDTINSQMTEQTNIIQTKMDEQSNLIQTKMDEQSQSINDVLVSMETSFDQSLTEINAATDEVKSVAVRVETAGENLEKTQKKYSGDLILPEKVMVGDEMQITYRIQAGLHPTADIYNSDGKAVLTDVPLDESSESPGLYTYTLKVESTKFKGGKPITVMVSEPVTGNLEVGSTEAETTTLTDILGLVSGQRAAMKDVEAKTIAAIEDIGAALMANIKGFAGSTEDVSSALESLTVALETIPDQIAEKVTERGGFEDMGRVLNDVATKLTGLAGEKGYDIETMVTEALKETPSLKSIRRKTDNIETTIEVIKGLVQQMLAGNEKPFVVATFER